MPNPRKKLIYVEGGQRHTSPIPEGVVANGFIFLSAVRGVDESGKPPEDTERQARLLFDNGLVHR